jgi:FkbM family methyltransferase
MPTLRELVSESVKAYDEGGLPLFFKRGWGYTHNRINQRLLLTPNFPPFSIEYRTSSFPFGHRDKYLYYDAYPKCVPNPSDTVVEAGVYRGYDTAMFAKLGDQVIGFEPSPRNYSTAEHNLRRFNNVKILNRGLWNEESELEIQYGSSGADDGFLSPDTGGKKTSENIPVNTLEEYVNQLDVDEVNFLKVEAEGAEPEILEGMGELRPEKIVVNADEERDGNSPSKEIMDSLQSKGYNLVGMSLGCVLFFVLDTEYHYAFRPEYR